MDVVLGIAMAPETVRMVLVEGEAAGGVTVDQDAFPVGGAAGATADQVVEAILGTRESAARGGYQLASSGVTWTDPAKAAALRDALAARRVENVMLVSAFVAAAALAQAVGSAIQCSRTALLLVEPGTATLAVVDTADGSVADVHRRPLPRGDGAALAEVSAMAGKAESLRSRPDGVLLVGSGVDVALIKPTVDAATSLSVAAPEEPEMALARGAALASANAHLGAPRTVAMPGAQDPVTAERQLAYSAESEDETGADLEAPAARTSRKPVAAIVGATMTFVVGVVALALAIGIRSHAEQRPDISKNVVAPATQPPPPAAPAPAQPSPPAAPVPAPSVNPPPQWVPPHPRDDDHGADDWLRRHLERGIPIPLPDQ
ncbi:DUF7159 family protein [Mycobacterium saskatchewanense]|nr:hypothetical protein [Mycobacterium saskatchewanense]